MKLYHGSNVEIVKIDLNRCKLYKDFGRGFYTTSMKEQAWKMAKRRTDFEKFGEPTVTVFELDEEKVSKLNYRAFSQYPTEEWAEFICNNRDRDYKDIADCNCNQDNKYDIVVGPVADDGVATTLALYKDGFIDIEGLTKRLSFHKLSDQYSFHTLAAVACLTKIDVLRR